MFTDPGIRREPQLCHPWPQTRLGHTRPTQGILFDLRAFSLCTFSAASLTLDGGVASLGLSSGFSCPWGGSEEGDYPSCIQGTSTVLPESPGQRGSISPSSLEPLKSLKLCSLEKHLNCTSKIAALEASAPERDIDGPFARFQLLTVFTNCLCKHSVQTSS